MPLQLKQLAQARPSDTNKTSIYSPNSGETAIISHIVVVNNNGNTTPPTFSLYHDDDGSTYDETTMLELNKPVRPGLPVHLPDLIFMDDPDGNLAFEASIANALTITVYGTIYT
jgi:hypothetical protein